MKLALTTLLAAVAMTTPALAQQRDDHAVRVAQATATSAATDMADGEVRKVDKENGRVTLRHGEIRSLQMPPMTMVFNVPDKAMLDGLKAGDKVRFTAVDDAGKLTLKELKIVR